MNNHLLVESDGALYRGNSYYFPVEIWSVKKQHWETYTGRTPKGPAWGDIISEAEAEELKRPD